MPEAKKKETAEDRTLPTTAYCVWCGEKIMPTEEYEHNSTQRGTEGWIHRKCLRKKEREKKKIHSVPERYREHIRSRFETVE